MVAPDKRHMIQNEARNFAIQSTASDLTLISAMQLAKKYLHTPIRIVNLVHDSILLEVPQGEEESVAQEVPEVMSRTAERLLRLDFPFLADAKVGNAWGSLDEVE